MSGHAVSLAQRLNTFLRFYVSTTPQSAEDRWQLAARFERLPAEIKEPGHWYRFSGYSDFIEVNEGRSGQLHPDGKLPPGVDARLVVDVPAGDPAPTLLDQMLTILRETPGTAPNHAQITEIIETLKDLGSPARAARLVLNFQKTLASVPPEAEHQLSFLRQASRQMVGTELLAGKVRGYDVAGTLLVEATAATVAATDPKRCSELLAQALTWQLSAIDEMASRLIEACWYTGFGEKLTVAFDAIRRQGEEIIESARAGLYPKGHPELVLDIYYGSLLQAMSYLLATNTGYFKLSKASAGPEVLERFTHRANTAEEKFIRLSTALLYAILDIDGSQLADKQARIAAVLRAGDQGSANRLVNEIVDLEFFYPPRFRSILLGTPAV